MLSHLPCDTFILVPALVTCVEIDICWQPLKVPTFLAKQMHDWAQKFALSTEFAIWTSIIAPPAFRISWCRDVEWVILLSKRENSNICFEVSMFDVWWQQVFWDQSFQWFARRISNFCGVKSSIEIQRCWQWIVEPLELEFAPKILCRQQQEHVIGVVGVKCVPNEERASGKI